MCKKYKAIFFDWDGTAVVSRRAPVEEAVGAMKPLLKEGVKLIIVSGTTIENIADGKIGTYFSKEERRNLFLGLGRGAYNYRFTEEEEPVLFESQVPEQRELLKIHKICFGIHEELLSNYGLKTDIVFSRPNYCKIDLMVENQRGENLFMQEGELGMLKSALTSHGIYGGLRKLLDITEEIGQKEGMCLSATCDAKYLEVGTTSKSDNVDTILKMLMKKENIFPEDCCYFGDEYIGAEEGLFGSDSFMMTDLSRGGDFYDVSDVKGERPQGVKVLGGGVGQFLTFLQRGGNKL